MTALATLLVEPLRTIRLVIDNWTDVANPESHVYSFTGDRKPCFAPFIFLFSFFYSFVLFFSNSNCALNIKEELCFVKGHGLSDEFQLVHTCRQIFFENFNASGKYLIAEYFLSNYMQYASFIIKDVIC